ncbi:hypothetical protein MIDIC_230086 [Alphaproteobacteria bacterium]
MASLAEQQASNLLLSTLTVITQALSNVCGASITCSQVVKVGLHLSDLYAGFIYLQGQQNSATIGESSITLEHFGQLPGFNLDSFKNAISVGVLSDLFDKDIFTYNAMNSLKNAMNDPGMKALMVSECKDKVQDSNSGFIPIDDSSGHCAVLDWSYYEYCIGVADLYCNELFIEHFIIGEVLEGV